MFDVADLVGQDTSDLTWGEIAKDPISDADGGMLSAASGESAVYGAGNVE
jgi:hypothetical protein